MSRVTDIELQGLIEGALHRSRSKQIPRPGDWEQAAVDAEWVVRALHWAGIIAIREQRQGRRDGYPAAEVDNVRLFTRAGHGGTA